MMKTFSQVSVLENGLFYRRHLVSFPYTCLWLLPDIEQKRIILNENSFWYDNSRVIKDSSNSGSFFILVVLKNLGVKPFYSVYV